MSDKTAAVRTLRRVFTAKRVVRLVMYVFLLDLMFVFLYPFLYMLITSIKSPEDVMDVTVNWLVNQVYVHNYALSWEALQYPVTLLRTVFLVVVCTLGHLIACSLVGYGFARFEFRGKGVLFIFLLLAIIVPILTGLILGPEGVVGLLGGVSVTGFAMAVFMSNAGGAWDNAKKYIEAGHHGGKGSDCHKAAVIGDTVGDPFKDTSGPSLNILIKLVSTVSIVFSGLIVAVQAFMS